MEVHSNNYFKKIALKYTCAQISLRLSKIQKIQNVNKMRLFGTVFNLWGRGGVFLWLLSPPTSRVVVLLSALSISLLLSKNHLMFGFYCTTTTTTSTTNQNLALKGLMHDDRLPETTNRSTHNVCKSHQIGSFEFSRQNSRFLYSRYIRIFAQKQAKLQMFKP